MQERHARRGSGPWSATWGWPLAVLLTVASTRSLLEGFVLPETVYFGPYVFVHQVSWMVALALSIVGLSSMITAQRPSRVIWMLYLSPVLFIPVLYALALGQELRATYFAADPVAVLLHTATFCITFPPNHPLVLELIVIFAGMLWLGRRYTRRWTAGLVLALAVHLAGNAFAVSWLGTAPHHEAAVTVETRLSYHMLNAGLFTLLAATVATALMLRERGASGTVTRTAVGRGAGVTVVLAPLLLLAGWEAHLADAVLLASTAGLATFVASASASADRGARRAAVLVIGIVCLVLVPLVTPAVAHLRARAPSVSGGAQ